jgi:hypothetical protein
MYRSSSTRNGCKTRKGYPRSIGVVNIQSCRQATANAVLQRSQAHATVSEALKTSSFETCVARCNARENETTCLIAGVPNCKVTKDLLVHSLPVVAQGLVIGAMVQCLNLGLLGVAICNIGQGFTPTSKCSVNATERVFCEIADKLQ